MTMSDLVVAITANLLIIFGVLIAIARFLFKMDVTEGLIYGPIQFF